MPKQEDADLLLVNGHFITLDPGISQAEILAIKDGKILGLGSKIDLEVWRGEKTRVFDLEGAYAYPGFIDSHAHIIYTGMAKQALQLAGIKSKKQVLDLLKEECQYTPEGKWIWGIGWDEHLWKDDPTFPTLGELSEAAPNNPVILQRCDTHLITVNQYALQLAKINANTPDVEGGKIYRDKNGNPTGALSDGAMNAIFNLIPPLTPEENLKMTKIVLQECLKNGITSIHNASTYGDDYQAFKLLALTNQLDVRIYIMATVNGKFENTIFENGPQNFGPFLEMRCLKIFLDGALGSRGAALIEPYSDDPDNYGNLIWKKKELWKMLQDAKDMGFQVAAHVIGDKASKFLLDAYEGTGCHGLRWRAEHAQTLDPADIPRFGALGVIAAVQPLHFTEDMQWMESRLGLKRIEMEAFPWRSMIDSGAVLAGGSDAPVVDINPLWGIYAAITRQDRNGQPVNGWTPEQRMTAMEALQAYTINGAYASFRENELGTLSVGKLADIVVLPENILTCDPKKLIDMKVLHTVVNGIIKYSLY